MDHHELQKIRKALRLNKKQLALLLKVKQPVVVRWESGERSIPEYIEREIEFFLGLNQTKQQKYIDEVFK